MAHNFKQFPELTNSQMNFYYFDSPHQQITESFDAKVIKVHDGDTIRVTCNFRDFNFPIRFSNILAPELNEDGGVESRNWLAEQILGKDVEIVVDWQNRVEKWGRLLGEVKHMGLDVGEMSIESGHAINLDEERGKIDDIILLLGDEDYYIGE